MITLVLLVTIFYLLLPVVGALQVQARWRLFRSWVTQASQATPLTFPDLQRTVAPSSSPFALCGELEAFEGQSLVWIGNGAVSVPVDLQGVEVYFLEDHPDYPEQLLDWQKIPDPPEPPRSVSWRQMGALAEGTRFWVWGHLVPDATGRARFALTPQFPLLVIAFEGNSRTVWERCLWSGRQPIEHWNAITPASLGLGAIALLIAAYWELKIPGHRVSGLIELGFALLPSTFFLPPGIVFFYGFFRFWSQRRRVRALKDLRVFSGIPLSKQRGELHRSRSLSWLSHLSLFVGAGLNAVLLVWLLRIWIR